MYLGMRTETSGSSRVESQPPAATGPSQSMPWSHWEESPPIALRTAFYSGVWSPSPQPPCHLPPVSNHQPPSPTFASTSPPPCASLQLPSLAGDCSLSSVDDRLASPRRLRVSPVISPLRVSPRAAPHSSPVLSFPSSLSSPP